MQFIFVSYPCLAYSILQLCCASSTHYYHQTPSVHTPVPAGKIKSLCSGAFAWTENLQNVVADLKLMQDQQKKLQLPGEGMYIIIFSFSKH